MNTAIRCLRQLKLKYLDGNDSLASAPAISGGVAHSALEIYGQKHWNLGDEFDDHVFKDIVLPEVLADQPQDIREDVDYGLCKLDWNIPCDAEHVAFEDRFAVNENWEPVDFDSNDAYLRGLMDVVFTRYDDEDNYWLEIKDWKTGFVIDEVAHEMQAKFYAAIGAVFFPGVENIRVTMQYTRLGIENEYFYCGDDISYARYDVDKSIEKFESIVKFRRSPSFGICTVCDQRMHCSGFKSILKGINAVCGTDFKDIDKHSMSVIGEKVMIADDTVKTLKKELKVFAIKHGQVAIKGGSWRIKTEISRTAPLDEVIEILKKEKRLDALKGISLSASALTKIEKGVFSEKVIKKIQDTARQTTKKNFKLHKKEE